MQVPFDACPLGQGCGSGATGELGGVPAGELLGRSLIGAWPSLEGAGFGVGEALGVSAGLVTSALGSGPESMGPNPRS